MHATRRREKQTTTAKGRVAILSNSRAVFLESFRSLGNHLSPSFSSDSSSSKIPALLRGRTCTILLSRVVSLFKISSRTVPLRRWNGIRRRFKILLARRGKDHRARVHRIAARPRAASRHLVTRETCTCEVRLIAKEMDIRRVL